MAEAGTLPFHLLVLQHLLRLSIRLLEKDRQNVNLPVVLRASAQLREITGSTLPDIYLRPRRTDREWDKSEPSVLWDIKTQVRAGDPPDRVRPVVQELLANRFRQSLVVYTDGSKSNGAVGAGLYAEYNPQAIGLPRQCSVFSAEAFALKMAASTFRETNGLVIMSDSASCLQALQSGKSKHAWIQEVENLVRGRPIHFCWIPGHAGVRGNVEADRLANEARNSAPLVIPVPAEDAIKAVKAQLRQHWDEEWYAARDVKLWQVKFTTAKWVDRADPAEQRALTRLRIGHTRLTHSFLLKKEPPPTCECCGTTVDVRHLILECRKHETARRRNGIDVTSLREALSNTEENETKLIRFLKETELFKEL